MRGLGTLSKAMTLGFVRDRTALFFSILFPLMFLVLFGGLFRDQSAPRAEVLQIGPVALFDQLPAVAREQLDQVLELVPAGDRAAALDQVRTGDVDAAIEQQGDSVTLHYSAADAVQAGTVRGILASAVNSANLAAAGATPTYALRGEQVEDESLQTIQYVTPGLLGWAVAFGAMFGAALTLVTWRQKKILRRLRLAPVRTSAVVGARVGVSLGLALVQLAVFVGVALLPYFGLTLSAYWWMSIPLVFAGTLAFLSLGLLVGAVAKTPESASAISNLVVLPMAFLGGAFFPLDNAPQWLQQLSLVFPLRHMVTALQEVMVRGESPVAVLPEMGLLVGFAAVVFAVAAWLFRWDDV